MALGSSRRFLPQILKKYIDSNIKQINSTRSLLTSPSGAIYPEPKKFSFPFFKVFLVLSPGVYIGAAIAKHGATILEENEIFIPTDDEEDD